MKMRNATCVGTGVTNFRGSDSRLFSDYFLFCGRVRKRGGQCKSPACGFTYLLSARKLTPKTSRICVDIDILHGREFHATSIQHSFRHTLQINQKTFSFKSKLQNPAKYETQHHNLLFNQNVAPRKPYEVNWNAQL